MGCWQEVHQALPDGVVEEREGVERAWGAG